MRRIPKYACLVLVLALPGCYHVTVDTGKPLSGQTIEIPWATSFVDGLVPIEEVATAAKCPNGVARVETFHSFLNGLANGITSGIYSPMSIKVTCAAAGMGIAPNADVIHLARTASLQLRMKAIDYAARRSGELKHPVYVNYHD